VHGKRDHDLRNGFRLPITFSPRLVTDLMGHPRWCLRMLRQRGGPQLVNLARSAGASNLTEQATTLGRQMNLTLGWNDIRWLRHHWKGPVVVKGILSVEDAVQAHACGADGIVLSNHGGRQLGSAPSPLELLPRVIDAVRSAVAVFIDGGIRRGADIAKACAMGAKGALLGRAPLYGLAARGAPGVGEVLAILKEEFEITLRLLGQPRACKLDNSFLFPDFRERLQRI
jgi:(S)-mandelate dehydrogenase